MKKNLIITILFIVFSISLCFGVAFSANAAYPPGADAPGTRYSALTSNPLNMNLDGVDIAETPPQITVLTHGWGGTASDWSNNIKIIE